MRDSFLVFVNQLKLMPLLRRFNFQGEALLTHTTLDSSTAGYAADVLDATLRKLLSHPRLCEVSLQASLVVLYDFEPDYRQTSHELQRQVFACTQLERAGQNFAQRFLSRDAKLSFFFCDLKFLLFQREAYFSSVADECVPLATGHINWCRAGASTTVLKV